MAHIRNLEDFAINLLNQYHRRGLLTWHDNIPTDEIWVKVGGDHGEGTFKMMLQIAKMANANSKHNTSVTAIVSYKDSPQNINIVMSQFKNLI